MQPDYSPPTDQLSTAMPERIRRILLEPNAEWPRIAAEPMTVKGIMMSWAVPLAAIGPVAQLIGSLVFGYGAFGIVYRPSVTSALVTAIVGYGLALLSVWVLSKIIDVLAPSFGGTRDPVAAMKVAAFSATASWLAQVFHIIPMLGFLAIVGLYSFYLLYLGLPLLMRVAADKAVGYIVATIVAGALLFFVVGGVTAAITSRLLMPTLSLGAAAAPAGTLAVAGVGSVDLGKLDAATKQLDASVKGAPTSLVAPDALAALLPTSIGGWTRHEIESGGGSAGGIGGSSASGHYTQGSDTMTLTVADIGAMGALASLGKAFNVQSSSQSDHGYERTANVDGRMTTTKWDASTRAGEYATVIGDRFTVTAEGHAPDDSQFKAAVAAIDLGKLAALAPAH